MHRVGPDAGAILPPNDEMLLLRIAQRDAQALDQLYERHAQAVYNLIMRIVREQASADEILQDTFWQVWRSASDYRTGNAVAWLYRIARNKSLDWLRQQKRRPQAQLAFDETVSPHATIGNPNHVEASFDRRAQREDLHQALDELPSEQRRCLELAYFEGMSQRQIAEQMQTPVSTIKTRIYMALEKLGRSLRAAGYRAEGGE